MSPVDADLVAHAQHIAAAPTADREAEQHRGLELGMEQTDELCHRVGILGLTDEGPAAALQSQLEHRMERTPEPPPA